jgi:hypothetical protein
MTRSRRFVRLGPCIAMATLAAGLATAQSALFPTPFLVEHRVVQTDADGGTFATPPVTDYYGGSWIVSVRPESHGWWSTSRGAS